MTNVIAEAYVSGISTWKVERLLEALGIAGTSKSQVSETAKSLDPVVGDPRNRSLADREYPLVRLDALTTKIREGGRVVNFDVVIAKGMAKDGQHDILGLATITSEDEAGWLGLLRSLVKRGLRSVKPVISDAHPGLVAAVQTTMVGASWQLCQTHFM